MGFKGTICNDYNSTTCAPGTWIQVVNFDRPTVAIYEINAIFEVTRHCKTSNDLSS